MRAFLHLNPDLQATMLDISPFLLQKQREHLKDNAIDYILRDFLDIDQSFLQRFDIAICNENLGDFPTAVNVTADTFEVKRNDLPPLLLRIREIFALYGLKPPDQELFHFNIGAIEALEKLCLAAIPYIFLSEHSCEASTRSCTRHTLTYNHPATLKESRCRVMTNTLSSFLICRLRALPWL